MDKVKVYLAYVRKYHFWILVPMVIAVAVAIRQKAGADLTAATQTQASKVQGAFQSMEQVARDTDLPTADIVQEIPKLHELQKKEAAAIWERFYEPQSRVQLFQWPKLFAAIQDLGPKDPIPQKLREQYQNYMKDELPKLYRIADIVRVEQVQPENDPNADPISETRGVVEWTTSDREDFERFFSFRETPPSELIRLVQEDYWLYEALLGVIAETNQGAQGARDLVITQINSLAIAQRALERQFAAGGITSPPSKDGAGPPTGTPAKKAIAAPQPGATAAELEKNRYVDENGNPLANRAAAKNPEFTFLPVYFDLVINQAKIPDFVANCWRAPLQIRVNQVTITAAGPSGTAVVGTPAPSGGGGAGFGAKFGGGRSASSSAAARPTVARGDSATTRRRPNDVTVQISGVLMMVNPPPSPAAAPGGAAPPAGGAPTAGAAVPPPQAGANWQPGTPSRHCLASERSWA